MALNDESSEHIIPSGQNDAHKIALELLKQLITLSSGVLALSATFIKEFASVPIYLIIVLIVAWACLIASILFGLQSISAIVKSRLNPDFDWSEGTGKWTAAASKYAFVAGISFFALFALLFLVLK